MNLGDREWQTIINALGLAAQQYQKDAAMFSEATDKEMPKHTREAIVRTFEYQKRDCLELINRIYERPDDES